MNRVVDIRGILAWLVAWLAIASIGCGTPPVLPSRDGGELGDSAAPDVSSADVAVDAARDDVTVDVDSGSMESCDQPTRVALGTILNNVSTAGATVTTLACLPEFRGGLRFYALDVPAGQVLEVTANAVGSMTPVAVRIFESCEGMCLSGAAGIAQWHNRSLSQRTVIVAIGGQNSAPVTFDAAFNARPAILGESCVAPIDVTASTVVRVDTVPASTRALHCDGQTARARWFRVRVPAGYELNARAVGAATTQLRLSDGCLAAMCLGAGDDTVTLARAPTERTVMIAVSPPSDAGFSVEIDLSAIPVPGVCASSAIYRASTTLNGESITRAMDPATTCTGSPLPAVFYRVVVGPGQRLTASTPSYEMLVRVLDACGAAACLAIADPSSSTPRARWVNETAAARTIVVAVSHRFPAPTTTYNLTLTLDTPSAAATCASAPTVMAGSSVSISSDEATVTAARCGGASPARSLFYSFDVPAGRRLVVVGQRETIISILDGCGSSTCLGTQWVNEGTSTSTTAAWTNNGAASRRVVVTLSHYYSSSFAAMLGATFSLNALAPQGTCATAPLLASGDTVAGASTQMSDESFRACESPSSSVPALFWRVTVPAGHRAVATLQPASSSSFTAQGLAFVSACGAVSCLTSASGYSPTTTARVIGWSNTGAAAQTVYLVAYGAITPFDLSVTVAAPAANSTCAGAAALMPAVSQVGQRFVDAVESSATCTSAASVAARYYSITVPAGQRVDVTVTSAGASHLTRILPACGAVSCLAAPTSSGTTTTVTRWTNTDASARSVIVAVSRTELATGNSGAFDITATLVAPPAHARCATPSALTSGVTIGGNTEDAGDLTTTCSGASGRALHYSIRVPAGQRVIARVTSTLSDGAYVRLLSSCSDVMCLGTVASFDGVTYWTNTGVSDQDVIVAVGPRSTSTSVPFSLTATLETPAPNGVCSRATAVSAPTTLTNQRLIDAVELTTACGSSVPSLYYSVTVPSNRRLQVRMTSRSGSTVYGSIQSACRGTCLASSDSFRSPLQWTNAGASDATVSVAVGLFASSSLSSATVDVEFSIQAIPEAGLCAAAPTLTPGAARTVSWSDASETATTCGGTPATAASLFYAVTVPAGQNLTATLTGPSLFATGIRILSSCSAPTCLGPWRSASTPLSVSWRNTGASATTAIIAVSPTGSFTLSDPALLTATLTP